MKKIIFYLVFITVSFNVFSQASDSYKLSQSEADAARQFLRDFKTQCKEDNNYASCSKFFYFPFNAEIYADFNTIESWTDLINDLKAEICAIGRLIPDNYNFDVIKKNELYNIKIKYNSDSDYYKIEIDFEDEDWTCEDLYFKKIEGKFFFYKFSVYSLLDLF